MAMKILEIDLDRMPEDLKKQLASTKLTTASEIAIHLPSVIAREGRPLDLNELVVGLWRKTKVVYKRFQVNTVVKQLIKEGKLRQVRNGFFDFAEGIDVKALLRNGAAGAPATPTPTRKNYSDEDQARILSDFKKSGKTAWAYSKEHGITSSVLARWIKGDKKRKKKANA